MSENTGCMAAGAMAFSREPPSLPLKRERTILCFSIEKVKYTRSETNRGLRCGGDKKIREPMSFLAS